VKTTVLLLLACAAGLSGCFTPAPVIRLTPDMPGVVWQDGRAIVASERPGLRVAVAFEEATDQIAMRVELQNTSEHQLDVDPSKMLYRTCTEPNACTLPMSVIDPEQVLIELDQARASEQAAQANDATVGAVFVLLNATASVAAVASGDTRQASRSLRDGAEVAARTDESIDRHEANIAGIEGTRYKWSAVAMRRTTLFPGKSMAGFVYLPIDPNANLVWLSVRVHGQDNWFSFKQQVIEPVISRTRDEGL
jgi:hypothetical protein